ncbi:MAG: ribonuclease HI family protein [Bacteroidetes bacterium]|nr:ribonuclease HI family protein [Bacteroidota bacterium]
MKGYVNVFTDGASRGNPGESAIGIVISDEKNELILDFKKYIGKGTNNSAEYRALIESVRILKDIDLEFEHINFYCDSELIVKQVRGEYKIKNPDMIKLSGEFFSELNKLKKKYIITHIPREKNRLADKLANEALNELKKQ